MSDIDLILFEEVYELNVEGLFTPSAFDEQDVPFDEIDIAFDE